MRFDVAANIGPLCSYEVFDANSIKIHKCIRSDTRTGLVERYVCGEDGRFIDTVVERYAAPLIIKIKNRKSVLVHLESRELREIQLTGDQLCL